MFSSILQYGICFYVKKKKNHQKLSDFKLRMNSITMNTKLDYVV